jgi:hypothetical protein
MRHALASLFVVLTTTTASAQLSETYQRAILPPAEFDRPYDGELIITRPHWQEVSRLCGKTHAIGCTHGRETHLPYRCYVAIAPDDELMGWDYAYVLRHEIGHCNGWRHDAPKVKPDFAEWCKDLPSLLICRGG